MLYARSYIVFFNFRTVVCSALDGDVLMGHLPKESLLALFVCHSSWCVTNLLLILLQCLGSKEVLSLLGNFFSLFSSSLFLFVC
jgi:hypothetical protein